MAKLSVEVELKVFCGTCSAELPGDAALYAPDAIIPGAIRVKPCPICIDLERNKARTEGYDAGRKDGHREGFNRACQQAKERAKVPGQPLNYRVADPHSCRPYAIPLPPKPPEPPDRCGACGQLDCAVAPLAAVPTADPLERTVLCEVCRKAWQAGFDYCQETPDA